MFYTNLFEKKRIILTNKLRAFSSNEMGMKYTTNTLPSLFWYISGERALKPCLLNYAISSCDFHLKLLIQSQEPNKNSKYNNWR